MLSLYGEIKSYVERIKSLLNKELDKLTNGKPLKDDIKTTEDARLLA